MTGRTISGTSYTLGYDAENRMVSYSGTGVSASFSYDGDGKRVKSVVGGVTTVFISGYYERNSSELVTKYYGLAGSVSAMRREGSGANLGLFWVLGDHLGSASVILTASGALPNPLESVKYLPWGGVRSGSITLTMKGYTGQYKEDSLGLYFYNARWLDVSLGRFIQADSIVPNAFWPGDFDRYQYLRHEVATSIVLTGQPGQDLPFHRQYPTGTWEAGNSLL